MMWAIAIHSAEQKILKGYISQKALLDSLMADGDYEAASVCLDNGSNNLIRISGTRAFKKDRAGIIDNAKRELLLGDINSNVAFHGISLLAEWFQHRL